MHTIKCVKESSHLYMFKADKAYNAVLKQLTPPVLLVSEGVFNLEITKIGDIWKNPNEDVEFKYIGESEHY